MRDYSKIYTNRVSGTRLFLREKKGTEPGGGNSKGNMLKTNDPVPDSQSCLDLDNWRQKSPHEY